VDQGTPPALGVANPRPRLHFDLNLLCKGFPQLAEDFPARHRFQRAEAPQTPILRQRSQMVEGYLPFQAGEAARHAEGCRRPPWLEVAIRTVSNRPFFRRARR